MACLPSVCGIGVICGRQLPPEREFMSTAASPAKPQHPPRELQPLPCLLSLLVPGLGQIYQGRIGKGVLFLVCIYALFFYGMWLGSGPGSVPLDEHTYRTA